MTYEEKLESEKEIIRDLEFFIKYETDLLCSYVNDFGWRESMWQHSYHPSRNTYMKRVTAKLTKAHYTTQKMIMSYLYDVWASEPSLYADCVKNVVTDKKALRELAKQIIPNL